MNSPENTIVVRNLKKSYGDLAVLKGVNLTVQRGTILALLGPNGAGKTTTIRILSTLLKPDAGEIAVAGYNAITEPEKVRSQIGLTGQFAAVDEYLTGMENLTMMGRLYHLSRENSERRAKELLEQFDLVDAAHRVAKTYSGGMRRRLDLALSLVATPPIIFLDEPTTGLDPRSRLAMWNVIEGLLQHGATILLTTQYLEEADKLADRIAVIDHGVIIAEGTADELKSRVGNERLEVIMAKESDLEAAKKVIDGKILQSDPETRSISISTSSVEQVKQVLDRLEKAGLKIDSLSLHKPTLDDVFLQFTGHGAEVEEEKDKDSEVKK